MATDDKRYGPSSGKNDSAPPPPPKPIPPVPTLPTQGGVTGPWKPPPNPGQDLLDASGPGPHPGLWGDPTRGATRYNEQVRQAGFTSGTPEYDQFIMGLQPLPGDEEYNYLVHANQEAAQIRIQRRVDAKTKANPKAAYGPPKQTGAGPLTMAPAAPEASGANLNERAQDVNAKKKQQEWRQVSPILFVDSNGKVVQPDTTAPSSLKPGGQTADTADSNSPDVETLSTQDFISSGGAVWIGDTTVSPDPATHIGQSAYREAGDMMNDVYRWNPQQTASFQKQIGMTPTGVADDKTVAYWKWVVNTARYYTAMGQKRTLDMIITQGGRAGGGGGGGGHGGGGGGGGGAAIPADAAKRILNEAMKQYAGREATDDELKAFLPAVRAAAGSGDFDGTQFATDWVKGGSRSGEVGTYQAATDYYAVVQQLIGGR